MANLILHKRMSIAQYNTFKTLHTVNGVLDDEFKNTLFVLNETGTFTGTDDCLFYMGEHLISYASYKKALSLSASSTDNQFPTAKCVYDAVKNKANSATTLSGYGITDAYTKTEVDAKLITVYKAAGSAATVSALGSLDAQHEGFVYNMSAAFETTSNFVEGAGKSYPVGTNVVIVNTGTIASPVYKYDILAGETFKPSINITWSDLKNLRDSGELVPGTWYRITDYICTTTQTNTQSAGHIFDVIVRADDVNMLNENALATHHSGDTYFTNSKLEAWELKYCIDNDTDRFAWTDSTNGKGVIYWMKDEWNNECPYDFKNIQFKRWKASWIGQGSSSLNGTYCLSIMYDGFTSGFNDIVLQIEDDTDFEWRYTFHCKDSYSSSGEVLDVDASMISNNDGDCICHGNVIKEAHGDYNRDYLYSKIYLNDIVFSNTYSGGGGNICADNYIDFGCFNMNFGASCFANRIGFYNGLNTFGNDCNRNTFENDCQGNTFGNSCSNNTFGNDCQGNTFGNSCSNNTFGNDCSNNTFGTSCINNTFGNNCKYIKFIKFGDLNVKSFYRYIIVENGNQYIYLNCTATTSVSQYYQNVTIAQGTNNTDTYKTITDSSVGQTVKTTYQPANSQIISI